MKIFILDAQSEVVEIINEPEQTSAVMAAQAAVLEAALLGKKYTTVNEDGESVLSAEFDALLPASAA